MDQNDSLDVPARPGSEAPSGLLRKPWLKFLLGFLGWFLLTLPAVRFTDFFFGAYVPVNFVVLAVLLVWKPTRLAGAGMAAAIAVNFLISSLLGTVMSPRDLAPVIYPGVVQNRWNFTNHYVSKNIPPGTISGCIAGAVSADQPPGRIAFETWRFGYPEIHLMNADGSGRKDLTGEPEQDAHPAWSPDGKQIAFTSFRDTRIDIYLMNADGSGRKRLTDDPAWDVSPTWSPDGKKIAFASNRDGNFEIFTMNPDGSAQTNLTRNPASDSEPAWSPDGKQIAFSSDRDKPGVAFPNDTGIFVMSADGTGAKRFGGSSMPGIRPAWSPNGKCILYQTGASLTDWIMLADVDGSEPVKLVHAGAYPSWSPDGRWLAYTVAKGEWNQEIHTLDLDTLQATRLTHDSNNDTDPAWEP